MASCFGTLLGHMPRRALLRAVICALALVSRPLLANHLFPEPIHEVGTRPVFVVRGDLDADGTHDLVVANFVSNDISVLLGQADGGFAQELRYEAGEGPYWMALGDLDGDGAPDLVVANFYSDDLSVYSGRGDGTLGQPIRIQTGVTPYSVTMGHLDADGRLDLAVASFDSSSVWIHPASAGWAAAGVVDVPAGAAALALGDLNADGLNDLVVTNAAPIEGRVSILLGNGDGTLRLLAAHAVGFDPEFAGLTDLDGDGTKDVLTANTGSDDLSVLLGREGGRFGPERRVIAGRRPYSIATGDFNNDGTIDLAASNLGDLIGFESGVSVFLGLGMATFLPPVEYPEASHTFCLVAGEFNGDAFQDLATANFGSDDVTILPGHGDGSFGKAGHLVPTSLEPGSIAAGDFNGDGRQDLAVPIRGVYPATLGGISILLGSGDGAFEEGQTVAAASNPLTVVTGDLDGDGRQDLAVATSGVYVLSSSGFPVEIFPSDIRIFKGNGDGTFDFHTRITAPVSPRTLLLGDFDVDGVPDLVVLYTLGFNAPGILAVRLGRGDGTFENVSTTVVGRAPNALVTSDFNHDGSPDLAMANAYADQFSPGDVSVFLGNGDGTFGPERGFGATGGVTHFDLGDFNADGHDDLAMVNDDHLGTGLRGLSVFLGDGLGAFSANGLFVTLDKAFSVAVADFDDDGHDDIAGIVQNGGAFELRVFAGDGQGVFFGPLRFRSKRALYPLLGGDLNGDGKVDLALPVAGGVEILLNHGRLSNRPPRAVASVAATTECTSPGGGQVVLDGSASSDPDSSAGTNDDILAFEWFEGYGTSAELRIGVGEVAAVILPLGAHEITLRVTDRSGATAIATVQTEVVDTSPPVLTTILTPSVLWPPDHRLVTVTASVEAIDLCGQASWAITSVTSSESDDLPRGSDGSTRRDIRDVEIGEPDTAFSLRAERVARGPGRIYTVTFGATDEAGLTVSTIGVVTVPVNLGVSASAHARQR